MPFPIAKQGIPFILCFLFLTILCSVIGWWKLAIIGFLLTIFVVFFFRDPNRSISIDENIVLSPADGRILNINTSTGLKPGIDSNIRISIFMSVFNCHINRIPVSGKIISILYSPGKFFPAFREKASLLNEQNKIVIQSGRNKIEVIQIAGLIARRIVCSLIVNDNVTQGERFGLIRFGSEVDIILPGDFEILVTPGQKVVGGITQIAKKTS